MMHLGIDTSCYTTSIAVMNDQGQLIKDLRKVLRVKPGDRGLMQSEAVFQHVQNLPLLFNELAQAFDMDQLQSVCVSTKPRPIEKSYMPVFTVCHGFGQMIAQIKKISFFMTSHQEGHLMAGIWSAEGPCSNEFIAVHLSGGTSEVLKVIKGQDHFSIEILGATTDLHAGQFVDRIGVSLGLPFPAGAHLEKLAHTYRGEIPYLTTGVKGTEFSFSGPETGARKLLDQGFPPEAVARSVEHCIATTLEKVLRQVIQGTGLKEILMVGGVAANAYLRQRLIYRLEHPAVGAMLYFAPPRYATDNAVGTACLGLKKYQN
ncbi:O-sialoglycoprotein endopeptidase [Dehalobacterium formicoaceticum]|uniref:N(6)-L-threonylcarbamoyladenine synthase n=2 Tax=Dehalobacterium formicoaceticum TaxID=51515 RepID=A0ABT1Y507_9FIRM|nr:O-sialoglycoprotein endopeptidase [Dehalobacterium formicoaceticum]MCR6545953.1 O-sialoglycoprotein endopeptidase [Dehalobacterium formicoaceticum]